MKSKFLVVSAGLCLCILSVHAGDLDLKSAVLISQGRELKPERVITPIPREQHVTKNGTLQFEETRVVCLQNGALKWEAKLPEKTTAQLLGVGDEIACLQFWKITENKERKEYAVEQPATFQRLRLSDGKWLDPLSAAANGAEKPEAGENVWSICFDNTVLYALSGKIKNKDLHERHLDYYRVTCFGAESGRQHWTKRFSSAGDAPSVGVGHWIPGGGPRYASAGINMLSAYAGKVVVCAGPSQPILALKVRDGEEAWKLENVWEFERGFIGPSVWEHYVARFGTDRMGKEKDKLTPEQQALRKSLAETCRVIGGPLVVNGEKEPRIFIAVAKSSSTQFGGYLAECTVYEVSEKGEPMALVRMPRMLVGDRFAIDARGVTWQCDHGAIARLAPSEQSDGLFGARRSDCIARLEWYRELSPEGDGGGVAPKAWLKTGTNGDVSVLGEQVVYRLPAGAWVQSQKEKLMHFPLTRIDLKSGGTQALELRVATTKKVPEPKSNYSKTGDEYSTHGPHFAGITGLELQGGELWITVGWEDGAAILVFDASKF